MNQEEKLEIVSEVFEKLKEWVVAHPTTAPDTERRIGPLETKMGYINDDLKAIKDAINSMKNWLISTLLFVTLSAIGFGFTVGAWKGSIDWRMDAIEKKVEIHLVK